MLEIFWHHLIQNSLLPITQMYFAFVWTGKWHDQTELMGTCHPPQLPQIMPEGNSVSCFKAHAHSTWYEKFHIFQMTLTNSTHEWARLWDILYMSTGHFCPQGPFCCFRSLNFAYGQAVHQREVQGPLLPRRAMCYGLSIKQLVPSWWYCLERYWMLLNVVPR